MKKLDQLLIGVLLIGTLTACSNNPDVDDKRITVGASPTPHSLILEAAKAEVEAQGYELVIVEFTDYILPNTALDAGDLDANYFQHVPYLTKFNSERNTKLASVLAIHFEPLGLYPGRSTSLSDIENGGVTIAIPNDPTNEARALRLLEDNGFISFDDDGSANVTPIDIKDNPYNIEFVEMEAALLAQTLVDVDFAVINGNYALGANIQDSVIITEDKDSHAANTFANILVVQIGKETDEKTQVLINALSSNTVKNYIVETFYPTVISVLP
jgi:D-methionine transport system substrate-binding protein